jgi:transposase
VTGFYTYPEHTPTKDDAQQLDQLRVQHADLAEAIDLAQDFVHLVRRRPPQQLEPWLARAAKSVMGAWQRFAKGLQDDYDAIKAGVTLPWSHGPVEGQITRLKLLKRQMFGRASLALLERRFVLAPGRELGQGQHPLEHSEVQARPAAA